MAIESTVPSYLDWVTSGGGEPAWVDGYEAAHPEVFETYYRAWANPRHRASALNTTDSDRIVETERRAKLLIARAAELLSITGVPVGQELPAVLMVGIGASNGWVADLRGEPTLFLALEQLPEAPYDEILVAHEALHLVRELSRRRPRPETVASDLLDEGLATAVSRRLIPGYSPDAYLWFDGNHERWLDACRDAWLTIRNSLADTLDLPTQPHGRPFFLITIDAPTGPPMRCGYYAGLLAADWLLDQQGLRLNELLSLPAHTTMALLRIFLKDKTS